MGRSRRDRPRLDRRFMTAPRTDSCGEEPLGLIARGLDEISRVREIAESNLCTNGRQLDDAEIRIVFWKMIPIETDSLREKYPERMHENRLR